MSEIPMPANRDDDELMAWVREHHLAQQAVCAKDHRTGLGASRGDRRAFRVKNIEQLATMIEDRARECRKHAAWHSEQGFNAQASIEQARERAFRTAAYIVRNAEIVG